MVFEIANKVALITGGASGLGLQYAKDLLREGLKAVTLADVNEDFSVAALEEIEKEFGKNRAIFVKTDVTDITQFEDAFKKTVETFQNVDILINNAGIMNDAVWQKEIDINIKGTVNGIILGLENYLSKYKSGPEGLIVNISSIAGVAGFRALPVYVGTKFAVHGMTLSWGSPFHYNRTHVRVIAIAPGRTLTALMDDLANKGLLKPYGEDLVKLVEMVPPQSAEQCSAGLLEIMKNAENGTIWVVEGGEPPNKFVLPNRSVRL